MIKNKQSIKMLAMDIMCKFEMMELLGQNTQIVNTTSRSGIELVQVLLEEMDNETA